MARKAVIDREELFNTANQLAAEGKEVSALALLNALGRGSLTTIYKFLSEWEAERPKNAAINATSDIPDPVQGAFASAWRVASMEAARETAAVREKAAEEVRAAQKQFEGALDAIRKLESDSEQDAAQIESLTARISELESTLSAANTDNAALRATAEQLQQQVNAQKLDLERLHQRDTELQKKLDAASADREKAVREAAEMKGQADSLRQQNAELLKKLRT